MAVTRVAEAGHDECVLVQPLVNRCRIDEEIEALGFEKCDALRSGECAHNGEGSVGSALEEKSTGVGE